MRRLKKIAMKVDSVIVALLKLARGEGRLLKASRAELLTSLRFVVVLGSLRCPLSPLYGGAICQKAFI